VLEPAEPVQRYERQYPGELIHLDAKKLGRVGSVGHRITGRCPGAVNCHHGIGWEFRAVEFLEAAIAYDAKLAIRIERVMPDNGSCYRSKTFRAACKRLGLCQIFTRQYTPEDQWQSRAIYLNRAARMVLRSRVPKLASALGRAASLAPSLQLPLAIWWLEAPQPVLQIH
jgi:transposase InsO family protein